MNISPASRMHHITEYFFSRKLKEIGRMKAEGANIINLGIGSPDILPPKSAIRKMQQGADLPCANMYQSYIGIEPLRQAFASWYLKNYNVSLNPEEEILPLMGSKEGIMHISMAYLERGDQVLIPDPGYPTYASVSQLLEAEITYYELREETRWQPNLEVLERRNLSRVKILWINYPHMPTGAVVDLEQLERIVHFSRKHKILLVHDNPYSFILNTRPLSIFQIQGAKDTALELNSLSKSHNMAGWRIGMVAGKKEFIQNILKVKSQMDSGMYLSLQLGAIEAMQQSDEWFQELNAVYSQRKTIIGKICDTLGLSYDHMGTGLFVWAKLPNNQDDKIWSDRMLHERHIFITPGSIFGRCGKGYVRLSLCCPIETLEEVQKRITQ